MSKSGFVVNLEETEIDDACGMRYWFHNKEGGSGVLNKRTFVPDAISAQLVDDIRMVMELKEITVEGLQAGIDSMMSGLDTIDRHNTKYMEYMTRRFGVMCAYALFVEAHNRLEYNNIPLTPEMPLGRDPLWLITRPTQLFKSKGGLISYKKAVFMPPSTNQKVWLHNWKYRMAMHLEMLAIEDTTSMKIDQGQVMGVFEGLISSADGSLSHPYVYGYYHDVNGTWSSSPKPSVDGWKRVPVWEYPHGIAKWVALVCGQTVADSVIRFGLPFGMNKEMAEAWLAARLKREKEIAKEEKSSEYNLFIRQVAFPRDTANCASPHGVLCPYISACWHPGIVGKDLIKTPDYVKRIPLLAVRES